MLTESHVHNILTHWYFCWYLFEEKLYTDPEFIYQPTWHPDYNSKVWYTVRFTWRAHPLTYVPKIKTADQSLKKISVILNSHFLWNCVILLQILNPEECVTCFTPEHWNIIQSISFNPLLFHAFITWGGGSNTEFKILSIYHLGLIFLLYIIMCVLSDFIGENFTNYFILKDQFKIFKFQKK